MANKKILLSLMLLLLCSAKVLAQGVDYPTVAGVTFGSSYRTCKQILDKKFNNGTDSYQSTPNTITYYQIRFANEYFNYCVFEFQTSGGNSYLSCVKFYQQYELSQVKYAKDSRDNLYKIYKNKYDFRWTWIDDDGFKYYVLGYNPNKPADGFIVISTSKGKTNGGDTKLWTTITYGPVDFVEPEDEI